MAYVYNLQTTSSGFTPYYSGAYYYAEEAFKNGGAWYDASNPSGIDEGFVVAMSTGSGYIKPYLEASDLNHITLSPLYPTGDGTYTINPGVGSGDVRGTGVGYSGTVGVGAGLQPLSGDTTYYHGLYSRIKRIAGSVVGGSGLVGIGTTAGDWPNLGYYSGVFTTDRVRHQFKAEYNTGTQSGSGVYVGSDVSLRIGIVDRAGNQINNLETSPFISGGLNIDLTTVPQSPATTVVENWQTDYQTTTVNVTSADLRNAFGDDRKDFGIRWRGTSDIGEGITGIYFLYNNDPPEIKSITWKDGNGKFTDESPSNFKSPNPSAQNATALTSHQTVNTTEKSKGIVEATVTFDGQDWADIQYLELYGYQSTDENTTIPLNAENLLKRFEVQQTKIQTFEIPKSAGVKSDVPFYYLWVPRNHAGKAGKTFKSGPYTLPSIALGRDPIVYNAGSEVTNQKVNGCFTVFDCLKVEAKDVATPYLLVNGDAKGSSSSHGDRLTLGGVPYLLSGDSPSSSNTFVTSAAFGTSNGVLTLTRNDAGTVTVDLDGRYQDELTFGISAGNVTKVGSAGLSDNDFIRVDGTTYEGRSASDVRGDLSLGSLALLSAVDADSVTVSNLEVDNFKASAIVLEAEGIGSHDNDTSLPTSAAVKDYVDNTVIPDTNTYVTSAAFGTSNGVLTLTRNDAATVTVDLDGRYQDEITSSNRLNANLISAGSVSNTEFDYLDGVTSAIQTQLDGKQATLTFGIASDNVLQSNGTMADNEFLKVDGTKIEGRSTSEVKTDLSLNNVENTALSTFAGSTNITTLGSISAGEWNGTAIADAYISSASTWNAKQDAINASNRLNANLVSAGSVSNTEFDYLDGVTSAIQTQLDSKQATLTFGIADTNAVKIDGSASDDQYARFTANGIEGRSASNVRSDLSLGSLATLSAVDADSVTVSNLEVDNFKATTIVTESEGIASNDNDTTIPTSAAVKDYVDSNDGNIYVSSAAFGTDDGVLTLTRTDSATVTVDLDGRYQDEITSSNRLNANLISAGSVSNTEFDYIDGVTSNIQTQLDAKQATINSSNRLNANLISAGSVSNTEFDYLDGVTSAIQTQLNAKQDSLTFGIATDNVLQSNGTMADNEFLKVDGTKIEGRSATELLGDLSLNTELQNLDANEIDYLEALYATDVTSTEFDYLDGVTSNIQTQLDSKQASLTFGISNTNAVKIDSASVADDQYARFTSNGLEGRSASDVRSDLSLGSLATLSAVDADSVTVSNLEVDNFKAATIVTESEGIASNDNDTTIPTSAAVKDYVDNTVIPDTNTFVTGASFGTSDGVVTLSRNDGATVTVDLDGKYQDEITSSNRLNANLISAGSVSNTEFDYIDGVTSNIQTQLDGKQASLTFGIASDNVLQSNGTMADNEFLKVDGTKIEGRSATEMLGDLSLNTELQNLSANEIDYLEALYATDVTSTEFDYLDGVTSNIQTQLDGKQASLTFGISNTNAVKIDSASVADDQFARFTSNGLEGRAASDVRSDLSLGSLATLSAVDADSVTVSNLEVDNFKAATIVTESEGIASNDNDTTIPTSAAVKDYVDSNDGNIYVSSAAFGTDDGVLTLTRTDSATVTVDLDGRYQDEITSSNRLNANLISAGSVSNTEFDYIDGVTSNIQTQLDAKQATIDSSNRLNANLISAGSVSNTEFDYIDGVTSSIQTQLDGKQATLTFGISNTNAVKIDGSPSDDQFAKFTADGLEGRSASNVRSDLSLGSLATLSAVDADSVTVSNLEVDNFKATTIVTESEGIGSNDNDTTIPTSAAVKDYVDNTVIPDTNTFITGASFGTSDGIVTLSRNDGATVTVDIDGRYQDDITASNRLNANLIGSDGNVSNTEFGYLNGVTSAIQTQLDAKQASLTFGISNTNAVKIDSSSVADDEYARFTSAGLESRSVSEMLGDLSLDTELQNLSSAEIDYLEALYATDVTSAEFDYLDGVTSNIQTQLDAKQASLSFGISTDNVLQSNGTMADNEFLKVDGTKIEGRSTSEVKTDLSLNNVENTAISTFAGSANITTLGSITAGEWGGTAIADAYISSASTWNAKQDALTFGIANTNAVKIDGSPSDDQFARFTSNGLEGRSASNVRSDLSLGSLATLSAVDADSVTVSNLEVDNFKASAIVTESEGIGSNDNDTSVPTSAAVKDYVDNTVIPDTNTFVTGASFGTSDGVLTLSRNDAGTVAVDLDGKYEDAITSSNRLSATLIGANGNVSNTEYGYLNGVTSAIQTQLDAKQASLTFGISNTNAVKIDSSSVADDEYARFTANGLESRSATEILGDLSLDTELQNLSSAEIDYLEALYATDVTSTEFDYLDGVTSNIQTQLDAKQASLTFGISTDNVLRSDGTMADNEFLKVNGTKIEGRSTSEVKTDLSLNNVENTAISTFAGSANITTLGSITAGEWGGTSIADAYISSASTWNAKQDAINSSNRLSATLIGANGNISNTEYGYLNGVSSNIQTQLDAKQASLTFGIADTNAVKIDGSPSDDQYARFTANGIEGRSAANLLSDLSLDSELQNLSSAEIDYLEALYATDVTSTEFDYLDGVSSNIQTQLDAKQATISASSRLNANLIGDGSISNTEFDYLDGVSSNIQNQLNAKQASLTFGISNTNAVKIDSASVADDEYARFTADGLESRSASEVRSDLSLGSLATLSAVDADSITVSNLEVDNFKAATIVTESEGIASNDNDTTIPTSAAVKDYVTNTVIPDTNTYVTSAAFGTSNGVLTLTRNDAATVTVDLDGKYQDEITSSSRLNANLISAGSVSNTEFDYIDGVTSNIQTQLDAKQASLTFGISNTNAVKIDSASVTDDEYAKFTANGLESRSVSEVLSDLSLDSELQNLSSAEIDYLEAIYATDVTSTEFDYLDGVTSNIQTQLDAKQATISASSRLSATLVGANGNVSNTEFGYLNGVTSAIQTQLDAKQATIGDGDLTIARTDGLQTALDAKQATIDSSSRLSATLVGANGNISNTEFGYLNGVTSAIQTQLDAKQASITFGISDGNVAKCGGSVADNDFLRIDGTEVEGLTAAEVKTALSLNNVENTAISTFAGSTNITTLGSISNGEWNGTAIADGYISSASTWNAKQDALSFGISTNNVLRSDGTMADNEFLKVAGTQIEGRSATELLGDLSLNTELQNLSANEIDYLEALYATDVTSTEFDYLDGVSSNIQTQLDAKQASLTFGISNTNAVKIDSSSVADNEYARFTANGLESRSSTEMLGDLSLDSELQNLSSAEIDYLEALYATDVTSTEFDYLDGVSSNIQTQLDAKQATISASARLNANLIGDGSISNTEFDYLDGVSSNVQNQLDAKQASLTFGISNTNAVKIDSSSVADDEYARFTANGLESRSTSEVRGDIDAQETIDASNRLSATLVGANGNVSNTEYGYLNGVTSAIQTQLDAKQATIGDGDLTIARTDGLQTALDAKQATIDSSSRLSATLVGANGNVSNTEYGYLNGVTSAIQTQLNAKQASLSFGISSDNVLRSNGTMSDNEFLKVDGTKIEGRSTSEVKTDLGLSTSSTVQFGSLGLGGAGYNKLDVSGGVAIGASYISSSAPSNGLLVQGNVGIGTNYPSYALHVNGSIVGSYKSFLIDHPSKEGKKLMHGCIEGPELAVYFRGKSNLNLIKAPDYWEGLVDIDSMTVELTAIGANQNLYVSSIAENGDVTVDSNTDEPLNYFYAVYAERKDVKKLEVEIDIEEEEPVTVDGTQPEAIADEEEVSEEEDSPQE
jgi:hypothetical protein